MQQSEITGKEAELYVKLPNGRIKCTACARLCEILEGKTGSCSVFVSNNTTEDNQELFHLLRG
jgi:pyruvate formate lyase activating enzyme